MIAIEITQAKKNYGSLAALKGVDLQVRQGEFFGLLGPNGAGKTTLIQSLVGLCRLSEGRIRIHGHDIKKDPLACKALLGYSPQEINLDRFFPIRKTLMYQGGFYGLSRIQQAQRADELLTQFDLTEKANQPYYRLSGGMQKRVLIAKAVMSKPKVLILDEPTAGVDVEQRHHLWHYLKNLNADGTTIILTTHYIDEAQTLCERIGIIHQGEICEMGTPPELIERYCQKKLTLKLSAPWNNPQPQGLPFEICIQEDTLIAQGPDVGLMLEKINPLLQEKYRINDMNLDRGSLEEVFLKVTGTTLSQAQL